MTTERNETLRIQKTSVRGESEVWILDNYFYKKMTDNELDAYTHLRRYSAKLKLEANISTPEFCGGVSPDELSALKVAYSGVGRSVSEELYKISTLHSIEHKDIEEKFGHQLDYTPDDFDNLFVSLGDMRSLMSDVNLKFPEDYESTAPDLVIRSKKSIDGHLGIVDEYPLSVIERSQKFLDGTGQFVAHRDLNWSNMGLIRSSESSKWTLEIADWGSFGFAYPGYDEGRLFTRLSLNPELQGVYLDRLDIYLSNNLNSEDAKKFLVSFWRTAVIRSHREIALTLSGRYENPVNFKYSDLAESQNKKRQFYDTFIKSHEKVIKRGVDNLEILLSN